MFTTANDRAHRLLTMGLSTSQPVTLTATTDATGHPLARRESQVGSIDRDTSGGTTQTPPRGRAGDAALLPQTKEHAHGPPACAAPVSSVLVDGTAAGQRRAAAHLANAWRRSTPTIKLTSYTTTPTEYIQTSGKSPPPSKGGAGETAKTGNTAVTVFHIHLFNHSSTSITSMNVNL